MKLEETHRERIKGLSFSGESTQRNILFETDNRRASHRKMVKVSPLEQLTSYGKVEIKENYSYKYFRPSTVVRHLML